MEKPPPRPKAPEHLPLPPKRASAGSSDSFRAVSEPQEEKLWEVLGRIDTELKEISSARGRDMQRTLELQERVDEHDEILRRVERTSSSVEQLTETVRRLDTNLSKALEQVAEGTQKSLIRTVTSAREQAAQDLKILELEEKFRAIGTAAGKKAGLAWGSGAALVGTALGAAVHYLFTALSSSGH